MAVEAVKINVEPAQRSIKALKEELEQCSEQLELLDRDSQAFADMASKVSGLQKELDGVNNSIGMASKSITENASMAAAGIVGGFQSAQAAINLFGVESEAANEALVKMQSLMALTQGIQSIGEGIKAFKGLSVAIKLSSAGLSTFKKALISTGLGALVVVLGSIIANWDEFTKAIGVSEEAMQKFGQVASGVFNVLKESTASIAKAFAKVFTGDFAGAWDALKSGFDIAANYHAGVEEKIAEQQKEALEKQKEAFAAYAEARQAELDKLAAKARAEIEDEEQLNAELLRLEKERLKTYVKDTKEYYEQIAKIKEMAKGEEVADEEAEKPDMAEIEAELKRLEDIQAQIEENLRTAEENEINKLTDKYTTELALMEKYQLDTTQLTEQYESMRADIEAKYAAERKKQEQEVSDFKKEQLQNQMTMATAGASALASTLSSIASMIDQSGKEGFETAKGMQIAAATINMLVGITTAISGLFTTKSGPWDIALAAIQAASIAAAGGATIAQIQQQQYDGGGSVASVSTAAANTTLLAPTQYTDAVNDAQTYEAIGSTKVYVTEGDIKSKQHKVSVAEGEARF